MKRGPSSRWEFNSKKKHKLKKSSIQLEAQLGEVCELQGNSKAHVRGGGTVDTMSTSLLHLTTTNPTVVHRVSAFLASAASAAPRDDDHRIGDFDGCYWKLEQTASAPGRLGVCLEVPNFAAYRECVKMCNGHPPPPRFLSPHPRRALAAALPSPPLTRFSHPLPPPFVPGWVWTRTCRRCTVRCWFPPARGRACPSQ